MARVGLAAQLARIDRAFDQLGASGVHALVRHHLEGLPPREREAFVSIFEPIDVLPSDALLGDIEAYVTELPDAVRELSEQRSGRHRRRYWDDDDDAEPSPVRDGLDALYRRVGERFLAGDLDVAIDGYRRLLDAAMVAIDDDDYSYGYAVSGSDDVQSEALARLLNALLANERMGANERAAAAVDAIVNYRHGIAVPTLDETLGASPYVLAERDVVLRAWLVACEHAARADRAWEGKTAHRLTVDLVVHLDGIDALARLARDDSYPHRSEATKSWLDHLEDAARADDALAAATEIVATMGRSYDRADLADRLARLHRERHDATAAAAAALVAFEDHPTIGRLAWLCNDSRDTPPDELAEELRSAAVHSDAAISAAVDILTGDLDRIANPRNPLSTTTINAAEVAVGALLLASRPPIDDHATHLCSALIGAADGDRLHRELLAVGRDPHRASPPAIAPFLIAAIHAANPRPQFVAAARTIVDDTAANVLAKKDRPNYANVARLVVTVAQTIAAGGGTDPSTTIAGYDQTYKRFSAFRSELTKAAKAAR